MSAQREETLPTRQSLLLRLKDWEDHESWHAFFHTYWKLIYGTALKAGLNDAAAQDIVQETIVSLATGLPEGRYARESGSFKSWLFTITKRRIADYFRRLRARPELLSERDCGGLDTSSVKTATEPLEKHWEEDWEKNLMDAALENTKRQVKPLQYQLFDCLVFKQWTLQQVCERMSVTVHQAYFAKAKVTRLVQKEVARLRKELR